MHPDIGRQSRCLVGLLCLLVLAPLSADEWTYRIKPGDNLWTFSERHLLGIRFVSRLARLNRIDTPRRIPPGTRIRVPLEWTRQAATSARVTAVSGAVTLEARGAGPVPLAVAAELHPGDRVRCGDDAFATVEFEDGSRMRVQENSEVELEILRVLGDRALIDSRVQLLEGRTENRANPRAGDGSRFEIETPAAISSVRGTRFRVGASAAATQTEVATGVVNVSAQDSKVEARAEQGVLTRAGEAPAPPVPLLPAPGLARVPEILERLPLTFPLTAVAGAAGYRTQIARDPGFEALLADVQNREPLLRQSDLPDGIYWLRARAAAPDGLEGLEASRRFEVNVRPEAPFVSQPQAGGAMLANPPQFQWATNPDAAHYRLQVAGPAGFAPPVIDALEIAASEYTAATEFEPGIYRWRIASTSAVEGAGPFSDAMTFRVPYAAPAVDPPTVSEGDLRFNWSTPAPGQQFQVQFASDPSFDPLLADVRVSDPQVTLPRPRKGTYYMRVKTIEADGFEGPFGRPQSVAVPAPQKPAWLLLFAPLLLLI